MGGLIVRCNFCVFDGAVSAVDSVVIALQTPRLIADYDPNNGDWPPRPEALSWADAGVNAVEFACATAALISTLLGKPYAANCQWYLAISLILHLAEMFLAALVPNRGPNLGLVVALPFETFFIALGIAAAIRVSKTQRSIKSEAV